MVPEAAEFGDVNTCNPARDPNTPDYSPDSPQNFPLKNSLPEISPKSGTFPVHEIRLRRFIREI